jgi:HEAT repeat protein
MDTQVESGKAVATAGKEASITVILKQAATVLKNMRTYQPNNPVLQKSFDVLVERLATYLKQNESLTLVVRENNLVYGSHVVYSCDDKMESLAFALYRDGIRLLSFRDGLSRRELREFMMALHEAREADPYQADLVTILWEKDLASITYRAVDAHLEDDEKRSIDEIAKKCESQVLPKTEGKTVLSDEFILKELGLSPERKPVGPRRRPGGIREADVRRITHEILEEDDRSILRRCSDICLETLNLAPRDDTFDRVADFLGRICEWLASSGDFLTACTLLSDLTSLRDSQELSDRAKSSIKDTIAKLGEKRKMSQLGERLASASDQQLEEIFAYLAMMSAEAVRPLCEILAECEIRRVRYLLCRSISVIAKNEPERLRHFIRDKRWYFVRNVVMILGMMGNPQGLNLLRLAVTHPEARVRREVARSVGKIRNEAGLDLLQMLIDDDNKMVRFATLSAMREIDATGARDFLEAMIIDKSFGKRSTDEKREVMRTYGSLGKAGVGFLEAIITGRFDHMDDDTQASAVYGIAMMNDQDTAEFLRQVIEYSEGQVKQAALEAITTITLYEP